MKILPEEMQGVTSELNNWNEVPALVMLPFSCPNLRCKELSGMWASRHVGQEDMIKVKHD